MCIYICNLFTYIYIYIYEALNYSLTRTVANQFFNGDLWINLPSIKFKYWDWTITQIDMPLVFLFFGIPVIQQTQVEEVTVHPNHHLTRWARIPRWCGSLGMMHHMLHDFEWKILDVPFQLPSVTQVGHPNGGHKKSKIPDKVTNKTTKRVTKGRTWLTYSCFFWLFQKCQSPTGTTILNKQWIMLGPWRSFSLQSGKCCDSTGCWHRRSYLATTLSSW